MNPTGTVWAPRRAERPREPLGWDHKCYRRRARAGRASACDVIERRGRAIVVNARHRARQRLRLLPCKATRDSAAACASGGTPTLPARCERAFP